MRILTIKEAAELLQVSQKTMYNIIKEEGFPLLKVSGTYRIIEDDFVQWLRTTKKMEA